MHQKRIIQQCPTDKTNNRHKQMDKALCREKQKRLTDGGGYKKADKNKCDGDEWCSHVVIKRCGSLSNMLISGHQSYRIWRKSQIN